MSRRAVPIRVVKLGGSLLAFDGLVPALRDWLSRQSPALNVLVPGGGTLVDAVRHWDQRFLLDAIEAHWLCVRLMDVTARVVALLLVEGRFCDRWEELQELATAGQEALVIFSVEEFLQHHEPRSDGAPLIAGWAVTSDSIAARLAQVLTAEELVLLKPTDPPRTALIADAVVAGFVDAHLPRALESRTECRCVNLLTGHETVLRTSP
jgi:5-(aminomethyl)-3-furanmethanol phosphate kinase